MDFALNDEQQDYKDRCRAFARDVIRPAARVHDEEESIPWDVIKEARAQGFGTLESIQRSAADGEGQMQVISAEEFHWGCAGIALAISGSGLAAAGIASSGTPEQIARWVPECFGSADEIKLGAYAVTEPQAGSDVKSLKTTAKRDGDEWILNGDQGLHHQRRHRRRPRRRRHRRPGARHPRPGLLRRPQGHPGAEPGQEGVEARDPRLAHRRGRSSTNAGFRSTACSVARRSWRRSCSAGGKGRNRAAPTRWRPSRSPDRWSAPPRSGSPRPPTSGPSSTSTARPRAASRSWGSSGSSRPWPTSRPRSRPPACWSSAPPGWAATASRCAAVRARCRSSRAAT